MAFKQPELPFALNALSPFLSEEQMMYHYGKHHAAYFNKLNSLIDGKPEAEKTLDELVLTTAGPLFNNAAQAWNHTFFWNCLTPNGTSKPHTHVAQVIDNIFGGFDNFKELFSNAAVSLFGSGWTWLATDKQGKLEILALSNADTPLRHDKTPILTLDVWEHAYYIDYRNDRPRFIQSFWDMVNWNFVNQEYSKATGK